MERNQKEKEQVQKLNSLWKEMDDLYHDIARRTGISDSAFTILYTICVLGDGCLQRDICSNNFSSKQTINSSIRNLERDGFLYLGEKSGRDRKIYLTDRGNEFVEKKIRPVIEIEDGAYLEMEEHEREEFLRLYRKYVDNFKAKERRLWRQ